MTKNLASFCCQFTTLLTISFIVLKLANVIDWPWLEVLSPIWLPILMGVVFSLLIGIMTIIDVSIRKLF
jgi:hypothetical protein